MRQIPLDMQKLDVFSGLNPPEVWKHFAALTRIPRPSGQEKAARDYVLSVAERCVVKGRTDARGNCVLSVPATSGHGPTAVVQSHLDMVCQKQPESAHDFGRDALVVQRCGDFVQATGTTLGADNGIGVALALALLSTPNLRHGPLELLFTVEEETALQGVIALDASMILGRHLINLDSLCPDALIFGCAGSVGGRFSWPVNWEALSDDEFCLELQICGLRGGHSGLQIHENRLNALKLLTEALQKLRDWGADFRIIAFDGGDVRNAIPREVSAHIAVGHSGDGMVECLLRRLAGELQDVWRHHEPQVRFKVRPSRATRALSHSQSGRLIEFLGAIPHGVWKFSAEFQGQVETSSNLAAIHCGAQAIEILFSARSLQKGELEKAQDFLLSLSTDFEAKTELFAGYAPWTPRFDSQLSQEAIAAFRSSVGHEPRLEVMHGGLECSVLNEKLSGLQAVSYGPLILEAHTPQERVSVSSVETVWHWLVELLEQLGIDKRRA